MELINGCLLTKGGLFGPSRLCVTLELRPPVMAFSLGVEEVVAAAVLAVVVVTAVAGLPLRLS